MKRKMLAAIAMMVLLGAGIGRASAAPLTQGGNELLQALPDGGAVILVDVQKVTASNLWSALIAQGRFKSAVDGIQSEFSELGVKLTDVNSLAIGFTSTDFRKPLVVLTGGFNQDDLLARLRGNQKVKLSSEKYKDFDLYTVTAAQPGAKIQDVSFAFYDAATAVAGPAAGVRASIDAKSGAKPSASQNAKLVAALSGNPAAAIRFAMALNSGVAGSLQSSQLPLPDFSSVSMVFGTVDVGSGLELTATLRNDTAEHAKQIAERLNGVLEMARSYLSATGDPKLVGVVTALKSITIAGVDIDVKITGSLSGEALAQMLR
ncbi:MAG TPA: hypothetical protein VJH03_20680 [Blastocatellia bacterium]|nr:hypothetical protein [Blastocatellia bacterium]